MNRWVTIVVAVAVAARAGTAVAGEPLGTLEARVAGEVRLLAAEKAGDRGTLEALWHDPSLPGVVRGRAMWARLGKAQGSLTTEERRAVKKSLEDPAPEVRRTAARVVGRRGERALEHEVLRRVEKDEIPGVRAEALEAVRRWTRLGHLFYLETGASDPDPGVRAQAFESLARLEARDLRPEIVSAVQRAAKTAADARERDQALRTLARWGRLSWPVARDALLDPSAPSLVRESALKLSAAFPAAEDRTAVLLDLVGRGESLRLVWSAFQDLQKTGTAPNALGPAVARRLAGAGDRNVATQAMAAYLGRVGYRAVYENGGWRVSVK